MAKDKKRIRDLNNLLRTFCRYNGHPNIKDTKNLCVILNELFFSNDLAGFDKFVITELPDAWGVCEYETDEDTDETGYTLYLDASMSLSRYLGTVAHELIHLYQMQVLQFVEFEEYDEVFLKFKKKFMKYNIDVF